MEADKLSVFDNAFFRTNKRMLLISGLWPYEKSVNKAIKRIIFGTVLFMLLVPNINGMRVWCGKDFAICGENLTSVLYATATFGKYCSTIICEQQIKKVYLLVGENWLKLKDPTEQKTLRAFAKESRNIEKLYIGYMTIAAGIFTQSCVMNPLLDLIHPLNETRPKMLPVKAEYFIDPYKNHFKIYLAYCIYAVVSCTILLSIDAMYVAVVHQSLATFNIVQQRLMKATDYYVNETDLGYKTIISAICMHKDALQLLEVIESSYGLCLLLIGTLTAVFLSTGLIVILEHRNSPIDAVRFALVEVGVILHLFYLCWPGQKVINHSNELLFRTYDCQWYNIDKKGRYLIKIMMMRCTRIATLAACGLFTMSFENYATVVKKTASYTAVALSING